MKSKPNFIFYFLMFISILMLLTSNSWFNIWLWLEINLISFISILINNNNKLSIESSLIYFLIQTISSIILLFSILMILFKNNLYFLLISSILIKIGSAPFHYWIPLIIESLNWNKIFLLLTLQKINPLYMLFLNNYLNYLKPFIYLSLMIGSISGMNYISMKKIMTFSSINQLSWMMLSLINNKIIKIYMFFYLFMMWLITKSFNQLNLNFLNQIFIMKLKNKFLKLFIFMNLLSLGGLPPFIGFFPKMFLIKYLNNFYIIIFMLLFSLLSLYMYMRIIFSLLMLNSLKINKFYKNMKFYKKNMMMKISILNNFFLLLMLFLM